IETELTVHALQLSMPVSEVKTPYGARPKGSVSKLSTYRDGFRIGMTILRLFAQERPAQFFSIIPAVLVAAAIVLAVPIVITFIGTGLVPRFPTAILATGLVILAVISFFSGMILQNVAVGRREIKRLAYLAIPAVGETR